MGLSPVRIVLPRDGCLLMFNCSCTVSESPCTMYGTIVIIPSRPGQEDLLHVPNLPGHQHLSPARLVKWARCENWPLTQVSSNTQ